MKFFVYIFRRFWAVADIEYIRFRNRARINCMILLVWLVAFVISLAPVLGWKDPQFYVRLETEKICLVSQDMGYQIFATSATFYVPLFIILLLYWKIFQTARRRILRRPGRVNNEKNNKKLIRPDGGSSQLINDGGPSCISTESHQLQISRPISRETTGEGSVCPSPSDMTPPDMARKSQTVESNLNNVDTDIDRQDSTAEAENEHNTSPMDVSPGGHVNSNVNGKEIGNRPVTMATLSPTALISPAATAAGLASHSRLTLPAPRSKRIKESIEAKRERKAARTLAIITGAFVVCWLPFFVMALTLAVCTYCWLPVQVERAFLWLGYFNSTLNPVIYTLFSPEFRQAFKRLLCGRKVYRRRKWCVCVICTCS